MSPGHAVKKQQLSFSTAKESFYFRTGFEYLLEYDF